MTLHALATGVLVVLLAGRLARLRHTPHDPALRGLIGFLVLLALTTPLPGLAESMVRTVLVEQGATTGVATLTQQLAHGCALLCLMLFFHFSAYPRNLARRKATRELGVLLAVGTALTLCTLARPITAAGVGFWLIVAAYSVSMLTRSGRWSWRYSREVDQRMRIGPQIGAVGLWVYAAAIGSHTLVAATRAANGPVPAALTTALPSAVAMGRLLTLFGLLYPVLLARADALRLWLRHWRAYRDLAPLWQRLHAVMPDLALYRPSRSARFVPLHIHRRYWRRAIEVRDGLVQLSPQLVEAGYDADLPLDVQAATLAEALRRHQQGCEPSSSTAVLVVAPAREGAETDTEALVALARALRRQQP